MLNQHTINALTKCAKSAQKESEQECKEYTEATGEELPPILLYLRITGFLQPAQPSCR